MTMMRNEEKSIRRPMGPDSMISFHGLKITLKILSASAPNQADLRQLCADAVSICDELHIGIDIAYRQRLIQAGARSNSWSGAPSQWRLGDAGGASRLEWA